uniref:Chlororespiratory reduction 21 n=1 Tax=Pelargonium transvaalense TaxID=158603 RepID=A0A0F7J474_9ROSI|nr:chlororespiratory reduction 21 [Pelargonium transvaalense]
MAYLSLTHSPNPQFSLFNSAKPTKSPHFAQTYFTNLHENAPIAQKSNIYQVASLCKNGQLREAVGLLTAMESLNLRIGPPIYGELLQGCVFERDFFTGQQIHARILKIGEPIARNEFVETKLLIFYAKCNAREVAIRLFSRLEVRNVFSWAAIIGLHCRMGFHEEALLGFCEMLKNDFPDNFVVPNALKACGALKLIGFGRGVHGYVVKMGFDGCVFVGSGLVDMYGKCDEVEDARKVFDEMLDPNTVAWNSMIVGYVQNGLNEEAIEMFYDMRAKGVELTRVTLSSFLTASANLGALEEGLQGHAIAVLGGFEVDNFLGSSILNFYVKVGLYEEAELVFRSVSQKDVVTWNVLISGFVRNGRFQEALDLCRLMRAENMRFDSVTLTSILSLCADTRNMKLGKEGHCYCIRNNLESDLAVASSTINMYAKCNRMNSAIQIFNSTTKRDLVLWNSLLAAYAELGLSGEALKLFYKMQLDGVPPNVISYNSLIWGFLRNGQVDEAKDMFSQMQSLDILPNLITWTTLISGLTQNGFGYDAILVFQQMQEAGVQPNAVSIISALSACTAMALLHYGKTIHSYITRHDLCLSIQIATSLVDMYAKCGCLYQAKNVFDTVVNKELPVYNAMISGYASHGQAVQALLLFKHLEDVGLEPDSITFTSILSACNHAGLVSEGLELLNDMASKHNVKPGMEHYGCVLSLLSKSGNLDKAYELLETMPYEPDARMLGSLLASCKEKHETELGEYLSEHLLQLEPGNSGNYIALSNVYATAGMWDVVTKVRNVMKEKGLHKNPGCSWIQIGQELNVFVSGDGSHPKNKDIYATLALLGMEMHFTEHASMIY